MFSLGAFRAALWQSRSKVAWLVSYTPSNYPWLETPTFHRFPLARVSPLPAFAVFEITPIIETSSQGSAGACSSRGSEASALSSSPGYEQPEMNERAGVRGAPHVPPSGGCSPFAFALLVEDEWSTTWRTGSKLFSTQCQREPQLKMRGEGSRQRCPKRQRFAKVSRDTGGPEARVWGQTLLISLLQAITAGG